ncbi:hypothetical protein HDZ31DRAFT_29180 [Schizophyllum fasciatum]
MQHFRDEWLKQGVRSTFVIKPGTDFNGKSVTAPCGLGWRFSVTHSRGELAYRFGFDPFLIHRSHLGNLTISPKDIQVTNMVAVETRTVVYALPKGDWSQIGTWEVSNPKTPATISFLVTQSARPGCVDWFGKSVDLKFRIAFPPPAPRPPARSLNALGERVLVKSLDVGMDDMVRFSLPFKVRNRHVIETRLVYAMRAVCESEPVPASIWHVQYFCTFAAVRPLLGASHANGSEHEYDSDSDIGEDDGDADVEDCEMASTHSVFPRAEAPSLDLSDDLDVLSLSSVGDISNPEVKDAVSSDEGSQHGDPVIGIKDHAYTTWRALIFYLYTEKISFKKLTSSAGKEVTSGDADPYALACSPKSMYRIANKANLDDLRSLCLKAIMADITVHNVAVEVFSRFSSKYPDVLEAQTDFLVKHMRDPKCTKDVNRAMQSAATKPHCGRALAMIWHKVSKCGGH